MILSDKMDCTMPAVPEILDQKLYLFSNCNLIERDARIFSIALEALLTQIHEDNIDLQSVSKVNVIFTSYGEVKFSLEPEQRGNYSKLIIYPVQLWNDEEYSDSVKLQCFIEELCHHFWSEDDEDAVNKPVLEILEKIFPGITSSS